MHLITEEHKPEQDWDLSVLRIIAAFAVVFGHVTGTYSVTNVIYNSFLRFHVPVFILLSGYYLLAKEYPLKKLFGKCFRLLKLMIGWSAVYYVYLLLTHQLQFEGLRALVRYLLTQPMHLWYLYAAITLYLLTPLLYVFAKNASKQTYLYVLALCFLAGAVLILPMRTERFTVLHLIVDKMKLPMPLGFVFLYLFGGYARRFPLRAPGIAGQIGLILLCGAGIACASLWNPAHMAGIWMSNFTPMAILAACSFFTLARTLGLRGKTPSDRALARIRELQNATLGIYLLHPLVWLILERQLHLDFSFLHPALAIPLRALLVIIVTTALVLAGRKAKAFLHR